MKLTYRDTAGYFSTAYLDEDPLEDGSFVGMNKHTEAPVHVRWDDTQYLWVTVCERNFEPKPPFDGTIEEVGERPECSCKEAGVE